MPQIKNDPFTEDTFTVIFRCTFKLSIVWRDVMKFQCKFAQSAVPV